MCMHQELLYAESERRARGDEVMSKGEGSGVLVGGGGAEWTSENKKALAAAYSKVRPNVRDFWAQVAKMVPGKVRKWKGRVREGEEGGREREGGKGREWKA